jgi:Flp pilus assembly pilin Flp
LDQKRLDEVRRIREAMALGSSILADKERAEIVEYARIVGMGGEVLVGKLLTQIEEQAGQPLAVMKMIEGYFTKLGKEAAVHKLSLDL